MKDKSSKSTHQLFIEFLNLNQLSQRTIQAYVYSSADLARFHNRGPALLVDEHTKDWLLHLIEQRKHSASSVSLALGRGTFLHVLPEGFTKIRHYGLLGNNRRVKAVPLPQQALRGSQWDQRPVVSPRIVARITDPGLKCSRCQQAELLCVGRLDRPNSNRGFVQPSKQVGRPHDHNNPTPSTPDLFRSFVRQFRLLGLSSKEPSSIPNGPPSGR